MPKYDHVGSVDVYRKRKESGGGWFWAAAILIGLMIVGHFAG